MNILELVQSRTALIRYFRNVTSLSLQQSQLLANIIEFEITEDLKWNNHPIYKRFVYNEQLESILKSKPQFQNIIDDIMESKPIIDEWSFEYRISEQLKETDFYLKYGNKTSEEVYDMLIKQELSYEDFLNYIEYTKTGMTFPAVAMG